MGQIVGGAAKPKRCNLNKLSQLGTPAAGEHILVSSDNSMNAAGQGNFDCYIKGDGATMADKLPIKLIENKAYSRTPIDLSLYATERSFVAATGKWVVNYQNYKSKFIPIVGGETFEITAGANGQAIICFLKSLSGYQASGSAIDYATGYSGNGIAINANYTTVLTAPADATYLAVCVYTTDDRLPSKLSIVNKNISNFIEDELKVHSAKLLTNKAVTNAIFDLEKKRLTRQLCTMAVQPYLGIVNGVLTHFSSLYRRSDYVRCRKGDIFEIEYRATTSGIESDDCQILLNYFSTLPIEGSSPAVVIGKLDPAPTTESILVDTIKAPADGYICATYYRTKFDVVRMFKYSDISDTDIYEYIGEIEPTWNKGYLIVANPSNNNFGQLIDYSNTFYVSEPIDVSEYSFIKITNLITNAGKFEQTAYGSLFYDSENNPIETDAYYGHCETTYIGGVTLKIPDTAKYFRYSVYSSGTNFILKPLVWSKNKVNTIIGTSTESRNAIVNRTFENDAKINGANYHNGYLDVTGSIVSSSSYGYSIPIQCSPNDIVKWNYISQDSNVNLCAFGADGTFIEAFQSTNSESNAITIPTGTVYIVASFKLTDINGTYIVKNEEIVWAPIGVRNYLSDKLQVSARPYENMTLNKDMFDYGSLQGGGTGAPIFYRYLGYSRFIKVVPRSNVYFHTKTKTIGGNNVVVRLRVQVRVSNNYTDGGNWRLIHVGYSELTQVTIPSSFNYMSVGIELYDTDSDKVITNDILGNYENELSISSNYPLEISYDYLDVIDKIKIDTDDIVSLNTPHEVGSILANMNIPRKIGMTSTNSSPSPLVLLHFSDIHGDVENVHRITSFYKYYSSYIHDVICTGDNVFSSILDVFDLWDDDTSKTYLNTIGNHDAVTLENGNYVKITSKQSYDTFFANYIDNWNVVQPENASEGKCYYYKDYTSRKIRLIVLDCMNYETEQDEWFSDVLDDVIANHSDYSVVVAQHYPLSNVQGVGIDCNFTSYVEKEGLSDTGIPDGILAQVDTFISNGGKFICHLTGHTHKEIVGYSTQTQKNQLLLTVGAATHIQKGWEDGDRTDGTKMQDNFNIVCFDTYAGLVKILKIGKTWNQQLQHVFTCVIKYDPTGVAVPLVLHEN